MRSASLFAAALALALSFAQAGVVADHGRLHAQGNRIVDTNGVPFQVAGMSLYWSVWGGQNFYNQSVIDTISFKWKATVVRAAAAIEHPTTAKDTANQGYLQNPTRISSIVKRAVDAAIKDDIYVIIDFHADSANKEVSQATAFFTDMAQTYGAKPNVIFEIWNEPINKGGTGKNGAESWSDVKAYANTIIPVIRQYSNNLIVVGTPTWSQDVDTASLSPLSDPNVAYTLHFYACTHGHSLIKRANNALARGIPLFITEFGLSPSDGGSVANHNFRICTDSATFWLDWADSNLVSWANWSLSNKGESSAALDSTTTSYAGNWPDASLSDGGTWIRSRLQARPAPVTSIGAARAAAPRPSIRSSGGRLEVRLPPGTRHAELLDLSGRILSTSAGDRLSLPRPSPGVDWVRWTDATGSHGASVALP